MINDSAFEMYAQYSEQSLIEFRAVIKRLNELEAQVERLLEIQKGMARTIREMRRELNT